MTERAAAAPSTNTLHPVLVVAAIAFGMVARIWVVQQPMGALDGDEAVVGLMARHVLEGEFRAFFWNQPYGGSLEQLLIAPFFALFGSSTLWLKVVPIGLFGAATFVVWRIGLRTIGSTGAAIAALLFWIWPPAFVWRSTKSFGFYGAGLLLSVLAVFFVLRVAQGKRRREVLVAGACAGLAWWGSPLTLGITGPAFAWLIWKSGSRIKDLFPAAVGSLIGAAPWLVYNLRTSWKSFDPIPQAGTANGYFDHLVGFFGRALPGALGLRIAGTDEWILWAPLAIAFYVLLLGAFLWFVVRKPGALTPFVLAAIAYPLVFAASPFSWFVSEPRYLFFFAPVPALLVAARIGKQQIAVAVLAFAAFLSVMGLARMNSSGAFVPRAPDVPVPESFEALIDGLHDEEFDRAFANYWIAYRLTFETDERVVATAIDHVRYKPHDRLVRESFQPVYVFPSGSEEIQLLLQHLQDVGIDYEEDDAGGFVIVHPYATVLPEQVPGLRTPPRNRPRRLDGRRRRHRDRYRALAR